MSDYYATTALLPNGNIEKINLEDYKGSYVLLLFYPGDFDILAKKEILAFADNFNYERFEKNNCKVKSIHKNQPTG